MEPNYNFSNTIILFLPFLCYYLGIVIRKVVCPGKNCPPLLHQFLLGIPVSLAIVCPLLPVFKSAYGNLAAMGVTLAIIIEHGMIVNETATSRLKKIRTEVNIGGACRTVNMGNDGSY